PRPLASSPSCSQTISQETTEFGSAVTTVTTVTPEGGQDSSRDRGDGSTNESQFPPRGHGDGRRDGGDDGDGPPSGTHPRPVTCWPHIRKRLAHEPTLLVILDIPPDRLDEARTKARDLGWGQVNTVPEGSPHRS